MKDVDNQKIERFLDKKFAFTLDDIRSFESQGIATGEMIWKHIRYIGKDAYERLGEFHDVITFLTTEVDAQNLTSAEKGFNQVGVELTKLQGELYKHFLLEKEKAKTDPSLDYLAINFMSEISDLADHSHTMATGIFKAKNRKEALKVLENFEKTMRGYSFFKKSQWQTIAVAIARVIIAAASALGMAIGVGMTAGFSMWTLGAAFVGLGSGYAMGLFLNKKDRVDRIVAAGKKIDFSQAQEEAELEESAASFVPI